MKYHFIQALAEPLLILSQNQDIAASLANIWVKKNAPPPKKKVSDGREGVKCVNVEECQEMAYQAEALRVKQATIARQ